MSHAANTFLRPAEAESPPRHIRTEWRVCRQTYSPGEKAGEGRPMSAQSGEEVVRMYDG